MTPSRSEIAQAVREVVAELSALPASDVRETDRLREDLGLDSLQSMELLSRLSERYEVDPDLEEARAAGTVGTVIDFVLAQLDAERARRT